MSTINVDNVNPETGYQLLVNTVHLRRMNDGSGSPSNLIIGLPSVNAASMPGNQNTFIGGGNPASAATGNTVIGPFAGGLNSGNNNTIMGNSAALSLTTGAENVALGTKAMGQNTGGLRNTCIGSFAGANFYGGIGFDGGVNTTLIGFNAQPATVSASNSITLGDSNIAVLRCAVTSITSLSDARDKEDVAKLTAGLEFVKELNPVSFVWNDRNEDGKHGVKDFGFIAQDLKATQEKYDMAETLGLVHEENPEKLEASYGKLIPILVKAIQELTAKVEQLEK
jgi:hypothetical protein